MPTKAEGSPKGVRKHVFSDARAGLTALSVYLGPFYVLTPYRADYLSALKAFSHNGQTAPLIRMLDVAQGYTHSIDWSTLASARSALMATNAFAEGEDAKLRLR